MTRKLSASAIGAFLCLAALVCRGQAQPEQEQCVLDQPIFLDDGETVSMEQVADVAAGTYTMRLTYTGGQSWIGIGINTAGETGMYPATAIIGRILDDGVTSSVLKYNLVSDEEDASGVVPVDDDLQTLIDSSFTQTDTTSVLQFTQRLSDMDHVVTDDSMWIWGVGLPDNQWMGAHELYGAFKIVLKDECGAPSAPAAAPAAPAAASFAESAVPTVVSETSFPSSPSAALPTEPGASPPGPTSATTATTSKARKASSVFAALVVMFVASAILC